MTSIRGPRSQEEGGRWNESLERLLEESVALHGHLCPGQILGVRLAVVGCHQVGVIHPKQSRNLIVYVEIDRCATDAIQSVTGCKLGKRTLKYIDYGKMAATFFNTNTANAVRVLVRDDARDRAWTYSPNIVDKKEAQLQGYRLMSDAELFVVTPVRIVPAKEDLPGHPVSRVTCGRCGEGINDRREVLRDGCVLCRACAFGAYYKEMTPENPRAGNNMLVRQ